MNCPKCKTDTKIINSRPSVNDSIRRRHVCPNCNYRFSTKEIIVIKKKVKNDNQVL